MIKMITYPLIIFAKSTATPEFSSGTPLSFFPSHALPNSVLRKEESASGSGNVASGKESECDVDTTSRFPDSPGGAHERTRGVARPLSPVVAAAREATATRATVPRAVRFIRCRSGGARAGGERFG